MKLELVQYNHQAINSCYLFRDFLDDLDYLNLLKDKIKNLAFHDEMKHETNVKGNMTTWGKLLQEKEFNFLHTKILETITISYQLRSPAGERIQFEIVDSWGMLHKQNEKTIMHNHSNAVWAAAFYLQVPHQTLFHLPDFDNSVRLEDNLLVFFQGMTKHHVDSFEGDGERISMACNISQEVNLK